MTTTDHKRIGILYILMALFFLVVGGLEATVIRIQLAWPGLHVVSPGTFNALFTMHGTTMVFFVGMPILFGFVNYLIPLMVGARGHGVSAPQRVLVLDQAFSAGCCCTTACSAATVFTEQARRRTWAGLRTRR